MIMPGSVQILSQYRRRWGNRLRGIHVQYRALFLVRRNSISTIASAYSGDVFFVFCSMSTHQDVILLGHITRKQQLGHGNRPTHQEKQVCITQVDVRTRERNPAPSIINGGYCSRCTWPVGRRRRAGVVNGRQPCRLPSV